MISSNFSIEEFVGAVKDKKSSEVIKLAVEEATKVDRKILKKKKKSGSKDESLQKYSSLLKQLIDLHRYAVKPKKKSNAYKLYMKHWSES